MNSPRDLFSAIRAIAQSPHSMLTSDGPDTSLIDALLGRLRISAIRPETSHIHATAPSPRVRQHRRSRPRKRLTQALDPRASGICCCRDPARAAVVSTTSTLTFASSRTHPRVASSDFAGSRTPASILGLHARLPGARLPSTSICAWTRDEDAGAAIFHGGVIPRSPACPCVRRWRGGHRPAGMTTVPPRTMRPTHPRPRCHGYVKHEHKHRPSALAPACDITMSTNRVEGGGGAQDSGGAAESCWRDSGAWGGLRLLGIVRRRNVGWRGHRRSAAYGETCILDTAARHDACSTEVPAHDARDPTHPAQRAHQEQHPAAALRMAQQISRAGCEESHTAARHRR
ncbi:hypothetical protein B0H17DRAFT_1338423 [Mycena rosella]|uniref:Uncharacterized protein n=1 Tax=Mycena rosella TaxID=1033263 RepID=A0AAD7CN75_MYCRO|nr:hypothetical protein B0H17DRAFT_1338423 [Mycena rosella]